MEKRIIELIEYYGLSSAQFADKIGVQRSSISHILSGRNKPSYDFLQKITNTFTNVDANWLLNGVGTIEKKLEKTNSSVKEQDLFSQQIIAKETATKQVQNDDNTANNKTENKSINQTQYSNNQELITEFTNVNQVKQIILIYENNTFETINRK
jgi:transcriptional regulator with XRE-family HTH domain